MRRKGEIQKRDYLPMDRGLTFPKSKKAISKGLKILGQLWERGLKPWDLRLHFFLTWFAWMNGNVMRLARLIGMHRNTIIYIFEKERGTAKNMRLRTAWKKVCKSHPTLSFADRFHRFYKKVSAKPSLTASQNSALAALWLMGMPRKAVRAHYLLWGSRRGMTRKELAGKLEASQRTISRIRNWAYQKGTAANIWLSPMKPQKKDWYPARAPRMKRKVRRK